MIRFIRANSRIALNIDILRFRGLDLRAKNRFFSVVRVSGQWGWWLDLGGVGDWLLFILFEGTVGFSVQLESLLGLGELAFLYVAF